MIVGVPGILIWGLGIPFISFIVLFQNKRYLHYLEVREKYGFLYNGFRKEFYFWESVTMYRKIALITISIFVRRFGNIV